MCACVCVCGEERKEALTMPNSGDFFSSPEVTEPFDELGSVIFVKFDVRKIDFEHRRAWVARVEEHEFGLP